MNTPVSFELAKLLKEKGFNQHHEYSKGYTKDGNLFHQGFGNLNKTQDYYQAPTIAEVVMWLYEKHGIWVHSEICFDGKRFIPKITEVVENQYPYNTQFNSPTEAYEAAIEHILTELIK